MNGRINAAVRDLQTLFEAGYLGGLSDGQLLDRFVARREGAVFEAIVASTRPDGLGSLPSSSPGSPRCGGRLPGELPCARPQGVFSHAT